MIAPATLIVLNEPVYILIFMTCFCRLSRSNARVCPEIRAGFVVLALASAICVLAPQLWGVVPSWTQIVFGLAVLYRQWASAEKWISDVPPSALIEYRKRPPNVATDNAPRERRKTADRRRL